MSDDAVEQMTNEQETVEWPTDKGIWMGYFEAVKDWIPMLTDELKENLPTPNLIVAQFPESNKSWPYTFQGCHSVNKWRRPTDEELEKAKKFHGISSKDSQK